MRPQLLAIPPVTHLSIFLLLCLILQLLLLPVQLGFFLERFVVLADVVRGGS